jgi:hypothetical protein
MEMVIQQIRPAQLDRELGSVTMFDDSSSESAAMDMNHGHNISGKTKKKGDQCLFVCIAAFFEKFTNCMKTLLPEHQLETL